eukprot:5021116-Prymnesium_polylepis.1
MRKAWAPVRPFCPAALNMVFANLRRRKAAPGRRRSPSPSATSYPRASACHDVVAAAQRLH